MKVLFKPQYSNIWELICRVNDKIEYLKHFPPFETYQGINDDIIIKLYKFALPHEWQKQLLIQVF